VPDESSVAGWWSGIPIGNGSELPPAIQAVATEPNGGVIAGAGLSPATGVELIRLATKYRLPAVYAGNAYLSGGALVTYGGDVLDLHRRRRRLRRSLTARC
jgi:hypothetical protein